MKTLIVKQSSGSGDVFLPPSKSHTHRALFFSLMAKGISKVYNPLLSPDTQSMIRAITSLGAKVLEQSAEKIIIEGCAGFLCPPDDVIDAGNSGIVLRFVGALCSLLPSYSVITGDDSIRNNRPVIPLLEGIRSLGGFATSMRLNGTAPVIIRGPIRPGHIQIDGQCSQAVSAFLMTCSFLPFPTTISVINCGEKPWIQMTLSWMHRLGLRLEYTEDMSSFTVKGGASIEGFIEKIPSDMSSFAFPFAAALITGSPLCLKGLDLTQGDAKIIEALQYLGASVQYSSDTLRVLSKQNLQGGVLDINPYIDALPILSVLGCFCEQPLTLYNGAIARKKECDRIRAMTIELRKMGAHIEEKEDGMTIFPSKLTGTSVYSHKDHRVAMSLSIAGLAAKGVTKIEDSGCIEKTYPHFAQDLSRLGFLADEK